MIIFTKRKFESDAYKDIIFFSLGGKIEGHQLSDNDFGYSLINPRIKEWSGLLSLGDCIAKIQQNNRPATIDLIIDENIEDLDRSNIHNSKIALNSIFFNKIYIDEEMLTRNSDIIKKMGKEDQFIKTNHVNYLGGIKYLNIDTNNLINTIFIVKKFIGEYLNLERDSSIASDFSPSPQDIYHLANILATSYLIKK